MISLFISNPKPGDKDNAPEKPASKTPSPKVSHPLASSSNEPIISTFSVVPYVISTFSMYKEIPEVPLLIVTSLLAVSKLTSNCPETSISTSSPVTVRSPASK